MHSKWLNFQNLHSIIIIKKNFEGFLSTQVWRETLSKKNYLHDSQSHDGYVSHNYYNNKIKKPLKDIKMDK